MDKIYSRRRLKLPKIKISIFKNSKDKINKKYKTKILKIIIIIFIALFTMIKMMESIDSIINKQCHIQAKTIATKIANEQATLVMNKYEYSDLFNVQKDEKRRCFYD